MKKNKYLHQLIFTGCILIIIPTLLFFFFFQERTYQEIRQANNAYYADLSRTFGGDFANQIDHKYDCAIAFCANNSKSFGDGGVFYEGLEKMKQNPFYYWEACRELADYSQNSNGGVLGVYYYDADILLYDHTKYSAQSFIEQRLGISSDAGATEKIKLFFANDTYKNNHVVFAPVWDEDGTVKSLLVGVRSMLGKNHEKVLLLSEITSESMDYFYRSVQNRNWEKYYVLSSNTKEVLFTLGNVDHADIAHSLDAEDVYSVKNEQYQLTFVIDASENAEQNIVHSYYRYVRIYLMYVLVLMTVIGVGATYFNYKPIHRLMKKMQGKSGSEFDRIHNALEEQQFVIMDLLTNHLVYGLPVSEEQLHNIGIDVKKQKYCVFFIENYMLDSKEIQLVFDRIEQRYHCDLYISDIRGEKCTVIIAFLETDTTQQIHDSLKKWCAENISHDYSLYKGCLVEHVNDINKSLNFCRQLAAEQEIAVEADTAEAVEKKRKKKHDITIENILEYLEQNYQNPDLNQSIIADHFHISSYSVSRIFKQHFGMGFAEYVNGKRIELAKDLLQNTDKGIKEIALAVGFSDGNYFSRVFRQNYGISPTAFRSAPNKPENGGQSADET